MSQGSGLVLLFHSLGEHDGHFGSWAFHKGGNGGVTQVMARAAKSFGAEIRLESPVERVITLVPPARPEPPPQPQLEPTEFVGVITTGLSP